MSAPNATSSACAPATAAILAPPDGVQRLLRVYLERINELHERPQFYHLLSNSCTVNIVRYANAAGRRGRFDVRHLLNGRADRYLYDAGWIDRSLPFADTRQRARVTAAAEAAEGAGSAAFSRQDPCAPADGAELTHVRARASRNCPKNAENFRRIAATPGARPLRLPQHP